MSKMVNYDSDSSGGEDNDFTETNVLLGYASGDANGEEISRLGGRPDWIEPENAPSAALARCKICKDLMVLLLQLNAELPDRFPGHERRLYIFACRRKSCRRRDGSIRAIRGVRVSPDAPAVGQNKQTAKEHTAPAPLAPSAASLGLGEALFGVKPGAGARANPFATLSSASSPSVNPFAPKPAGAATSASTNPFAPKPAAPPATTREEETKQAAEPEAAKTLPETFAQKLSLNNSPSTQAPPPPAREPWPPSTSQQAAPYPIRWLADAEFETLDPTPAPLPAQATNIMDIDTEGGSGSATTGKEDKEVFESSHDSVFQKFADRVGQNPEQCIRYEFAGQPLLYSKGDAVGQLLFAAAGGGEGEEGDVKVKATSGGKGGFPRCANCGAGRVFEVQLAPHAIEELEVEEDGLDGMDWGTVIVAVCERDCLERGVGVGEAGYVEEWAGVQWEELTAKR